jgi:hypothetical protein
MSKCLLPLQLLREVRWPSSIKPFTAWTWRGTPRCPFSHFELLVLITLVLQRSAIAWLTAVPGSAGRSQRIR